MSGFSVSVAALTKIVSDLTNLSEGLPEHTVMGFSLEPNAVYHEGLRDELETFHDRLVSAMTLLRDDTGEVAHSLKLSADAYGQMDWEGAQRFAVNES